MAKKKNAALQMALFRLHLTNRCPTFPGIRPAPMRLSSSPMQPHPSPAQRRRASPTLAAAIVCAAACTVPACTSTKAPPVPQLDCSASSPRAAAGGGWPQWGLDPGHSGTTCAEGQPLASVLARIVIDENVAAEKQEMGGDLLVHYQQPLLVGDDVYLAHKAGQYVVCDPPGSGKPGCGAQAWSWQQWSERAFRWTSGALVQRWEFKSDWTPPPNGPTLFGWEPVFHAAVSGGTLWVPGAGGRVYQVNRDTGALLRTIDPFNVDARVFVTSPIVVDPDGNALYTALTLDPQDPWGFGTPPADAAGWLVRVTPGGVPTRVSFGALNPAAPLATGTCEVGFGGNVTRPLPPADVGGVAVAAPRVRCGVQRPAINAAPVVGKDGTLFLVSRAHRTERDSFLLALKPTLELKWAASLRDRLGDGCGVTVPADGDAKNGHCRAGARTGVDPSTNNLPAGRANDESSASPIALPDGGVLYGALTTYNGSRGHLLKFDEDGAFKASYDFGWDSTPAVFPHGGTYSIVLKDNHYNDGPFYLTQLDEDLEVAWKFTSFETRSCEAAPGGPVCVDDHPGGFEWCVNSVAVDRFGTTYANSEDGHLYAIDSGGKLRDRIFLDTARGAAYTPISLDDQGRLYPQNNGVLFVVGRQ